MKLRNGARLGHLSGRVRTRCDAKPLELLALEDWLLCSEIKGKATNEETKIISRTRELYNL
jgi:hypothetical protein